MATSVRANFAFVLLVVTVCRAPAAAQTSGVTLRQAVNEIRDALTLVNPGFDDEEPELARDLTKALQELEVSGVLDGVPVRPPVEETTAGFLARARLGQPAFELSTFLASSTLRALWDTVRTARNRNQGSHNLPSDQPRGILRRLQDDPGIDDEAIRDMFRAYEEVEGVLRRWAMEQARNRLGRYERKFGPESVRLNAIEVGIAYLLQDVRGFHYDLDDGPGPLEVVASYTTTYLSRAEEEFRIVSAFEFGLRHYNFGDGWGRDGFRGYLLPGHLSFGMVIAGEKDGPLVWPGSGESRAGAFVAWGDVKLAYVSGPNAKWLVARQFQIFPLAF